MNSIHYNTAYSDPPENAWLWFHGAGHFHVDEKYGITVPNGYFASTIFLTVNGSGRYSWNKTEHDDQPHSITILPEGKIRNGWRTAIKPWDFYWALYRGEGFRSFAAQFGITLPVFNVPVPQKWTGILCERYESLFRAMGETGSRAFLKQQREGMALFQFVVDVIHKHQESDTRPVIYGKDLIDELDRYLASNRTGGDRVDEFARMAGVSPEHMTRTLRRHTGLTPKKYFLRHRIGQARELLITSALSIGEIGSRCGFPDPYHFSKAFKQQTGMSPMAFRMHNPMAIGQKSTL